MLKPRYYINDQGVSYAYQEASSLGWEPLYQITLHPDHQSRGVHEVWENARYTVIVRRYPNESQEQGHGRGEP
jgi:hypothetical protein